MNKNEAKRLETVREKYIEMVKKSDIYYRKDRMKQIEKAWGMACNFFDGGFKPVLLKKGNHKLSKNIIIWDIPEVITCKMACPNCYAVKSSRQYKNTRLMRLYHLAIILMAIEFQDKKEYLLQYIQKEIKKHVNYCNKKNRMPIMRIHGSGDIFCPEYLAIIEEIAWNNPQIKLYSYSKQLTSRQIDDINNMHDNLNIIKSIVTIKNKRFLNFGSLETVKNIEKMLIADGQKAYICKYGIKGEPEQACGVNCTECLHCPNVLFKQH